MLAKTLTVTWLVLSVAALTASSSIKLSKLIYDDDYITDNLELRYPYLKRLDGSYVGPKDYFNFTQVFSPSRKFLEQLNVEQFLYKEFQQAEISSSIATMDQWHYSDHSQRMQLDAINTDKKLCSSQLDYLVGELQKADQNSSFDQLFEPGFRNIQLLRFIDSWGRPAPETYFGNSYWTGSHRGCNLVELPVDDGSEQHLKFRYCWAKMRAKSWNQTDEMRPERSFRVGVCLPESCDSETALEKRSAIYRLLSFNFSPLHRQRFNSISHIYCLPKPTGLSQAARIYLTLMLSWLMLLSILSMFAYFTNTSSKLIRAVTIQDNLSRFLSDDQPPASLSGRVDLRPLGVLRFFASLAIVTAHCICTFGWIFYSSTLNNIQGRKLRYQVMPSFWKSMDWYLVFGGLLASYTLTGKFPGKRLVHILKPSVYLNINLARYLRLAPTMVLVLAFIKAVYPHLADGPMWDYGTYQYSLQGQCQRSNWWRILGFPIIYGYEGNPYYHECLAPSWYLITDMKIFLAVPFIVYLMSRPKAKRFGLLLVLVALSTLHQYKDLTMQPLIHFQQVFSYGSMFAANILNLRFAESGYYSAISRLACVAVGLYSGIYLREYQNGKLAGWPFWMNGKFLLAALLWQLYDFFSPYLSYYQYLQSGYIPAEESIKLIVLLKPRIDSVLYAMITLRLVTDLAPKLMQYSKSFYKLSKLSYCVYLVHAIVISFSLSAHERARMDSYILHLLMLIAFTILTSYVISFPLHILVESPLNSLLSLMMSSNKRESSEEQESTSLELEWSKQQQVKSRHSKRD